MTVNSMQNGWEVLYQRNHAMLAAALASAWDEDLRVHPPSLWSETLVAIASMTIMKQLSVGWLNCLWRRTYWNAHTLSCAGAIACR
jgi:hypothetical protein